MRCLAAAEGPRLDLGAFVESSDACYIVGTGEQQRHVAPVVAGFLGDLRQEIYRRSASAAPARRVLLVLDELAHIAPLDDLPSLVAEGASQGITTLACLQDLSQAEARWGAAASGFLSLFNTNVVLPGIGDRRTLEALSLLSGDGDVHTRSVSRDRWRWHGSSTDSTRLERRVAPDQIANAARGSAIVVDGARLGRVNLTPAYRTAPWAQLVDLPIRIRAESAEDPGPPRRFGRSRIEVARGRH